MQQRRFNSIILPLLLTVATLVGSGFLWSSNASASGPKAPQACSGLFFSEYIEGSSNNKAVEIYNGTGAPVNLSGYSVRNYANGGTTANPIINLSGTVADGDVYVVAHSSAAAAILAVADQTTGAGLWNGDDAIELFDGTSTIDVIGQIGFDPGSEWGSGLTSTADNTLVRKSTVSMGDSNGADAFDPSIEWDGYATDTFSYLGAHSADCAGSTATPTPGPSPTPTATATPPTLTLIHDIQGSGTSSPLVGNTVVIEGVVVGDFQGSGALSGFFVQEEDADADADPLTSEGIFIYEGSSSAVAVNEGDLVQVTGTVTEYADRTVGGGTLTQLSSPTVTIVGSGSVTPAMPTLPEAVDGDLEAVEGMLVSFGSLTVSQNYFLGRYGQMTLSASGRLYQPTNQEDPRSAAADSLADFNARSMLILDDGTAGSRCGDNPTLVPYLGPAPGMVLRAGDTASNLLGVLDYGQIDSGETGGCNVGSTLFSGDYRLHPVQAPTFANSNPRPASPNPVGGDLQVASFNVLNYFNGNGLGGGFPTSRGADTAAEFTRQRDKIIDAITTMDAEVIGLMELENDFADGANSAIADLTNGLNAATLPGTYAYIDPGSNVGTDEITVGIIYKPAVVAPVGTLAILDDPAFTDPRATGIPKSRPAMAQTFEVIDTSLDSLGGAFTVVVNHLKSKGSNCGAGDDDTTYRQGNCNGTRTDGADYLVNSWLPTDPTGTAALYGSADMDYLIMGDLNAYAQEDPIMEITGAGYTNLIDLYVGSTGYSYIFDGASGYLDHALSSTTLTDQVVGTTEWHINTDEPEVINYNNEFNSGPYYSADAYRSSDHDPVLIGLELEPTADFGDSATSYGAAWHTGGGLLRLGTLWDTDASDAVVDSDNPTDDGVTFAATATTVTASVEVVRTDSGSDPAWLTGWVDWDQSGTFDLGEIVLNQAVTVGNNSLGFAVPGGANPLTNTYITRFRLYDSPTEPAPDALLAALPTGGAVGGEVEDGTLGEVPTSTNLALFNGEPMADGIKLSWATISEETLEGFNLLRSTDPAAPATPINSELILAMGNGQGHEYTWLDSDVVAATGYYYWLDAVEVDGSHQIIGPIEVTAASPTAVTLGTLQSSGQPRSALAAALLLLGLATIGMAWQRRQRC